jgi:hypothetical protein
MRTFKSFVSEELVKSSGTQKGSNPGGIHTDTETGKQYYIKHYNNADQAKSEALAGKIYHHMGIHTVSPEYREIDGKPSIVTEYNPHVHQMHPSEFDNVNAKQAEHLGRMYHGATLTKNWDIVGLEHDNILRHKNTGDLHSIDQGGTFNFRAQGGHKDYGPDISENESLRDPSRPSGHVFNTAFKLHPNAERNSLDSVRDMDDNHVHELFKNSGLSNWKELHSNFMKRKTALLKKYDKK